MLIRTGFPTQSPRRVNALGSKTLARKIARANKHVVVLKSMANRNTLRAKIIAAFRRLFPPPPRGEPFRIAAFGDSLTAGFGLKTKEAFPPVLERRLRADGYNAVVFNAGVSGDTTQMGLARLEAMLAEHAKARHPRTRRE